MMYSQILYLTQNLQQLRAKATLCDIKTIMWSQEHRLNYRESPIHKETSSFLSTKAGSTCFLLCLSQWWFLSGWSWGH